MIEDKIVWILGAGFSKSLGAPLLADLFSPESLQRIFTAWKHTFNEDDARRVLRLYLGGVHGLDHIKDNERRYWAHAEEFLERLDRARKDNLEAAMLVALADELPERVIHGAKVTTYDMFHTRTTEEFRLVALKLIAAECCAFLRNADTKTERWQPYVDWADDLGQDDTVITFNYDRVPELLGKLECVLPAQVEYVSGQEQSVSIIGYRMPKLLKLHGSVDWKLTKDGATEVVHEGNVISVRDPLVGEYAVHFDNVDHFAMATPGPTKRNMIEGVVKVEGTTLKTPPLKALWDAARHAIREADAIVCVGYQMPPTDAYTRKWLIGALRENAKMKKAKRLPLTSKLAPPSEANIDSPRLPIHTVLGSDVNGHASRRLRGLLEAADPGRRIHVEQWPMYAEDFLGVVDRRLLLKDPPWPD